MAVASVIVCQIGRSVAVASVIVCQIGRSVAVASVIVCQIGRSVAAACTFAWSGRKVGGHSICCCQARWDVSWPQHLLWSGQRVCLLVGCLTSQQQASVSQGRICSDNFTCCHTEIEVADPTFYLTQSQYTDTGPTSPSADPIMPGAWQGSHWSANF